MQVANLDMPVSIAKRPAPPGEWQISCDASLSGDIARAFAQIDERWGALDGLVHLAGFTPPPVALRDTDENAWDAVMNVNIRGAFPSVRAALPLLDKGPMQPSC